MPAPQIYMEFSLPTYWNPGDTVITFNYDLAVDRELRRARKWSIGNGYGFEVLGFEDSPSELFKLHGSTNWRSEPFGGLRHGGITQLSGSPLGERPVIRDEEFTYLGYKNASDPQCNNGPVQLDTIIMPSANKKFYMETSFGREWEELWDSLWFQAGEALEKSTEVFLIGYSLPQYDIRARDLLATKIGSDIPIKVCCHTGTDGAIESLKQLSLRAEPAAATTFADWIQHTRQE